MSHDKPGARWPWPKGAAADATPAGRDATICHLQEHYANNHLELAEYERRVELAEGAPTNAALLALAADLPALPPPPAHAIVAAVRGRVTASMGATLGATSRRGRWQVPPVLKVRAVLGKVELDLSEAELGGGETVLLVSALLGRVVVIVPEGLAIDCQGSAIFGAFDHLVQTAASKRDDRRLRIIGSAKLGRVDLIVRRKTGVLEEIKNAVRGLLGG